MTRAEKRVANEHRRQSYQGMIQKCLEDSFYKNKDLARAWAETDKYIHRIILKEPINADIIRSAYMRVKISVAEKNKR